MGTFQPNKRKSQTASRTKPTEAAVQSPKRARPTNAVQFQNATTPKSSGVIPRPALRSTPHSSNNLTFTPYPYIPRFPHRVKAIHEFDKLINFLLEHRPQVADCFVTACWDLYKEKYRNKNKKSTDSAPPTSESRPSTNPPAPAASETPNATSQPTHDPKIVTNSDGDHLSLPSRTTANGSAAGPSPARPQTDRLNIPPSPPSQFSNIPILAKQSELERHVYQRWRTYETTQRPATEHLSHEDQQYVVWKYSESGESPVVLDAKSCCMALLDANSKLSDVHLQALRFLWLTLIEDNCTGAVFNHGMGYPRAHIIYLFAQLVISSPGRAKSRVLVICPRYSHNQWEMANEPDVYDIEILHLSIQHWQENINQWRAHGGVLVASDEAYDNILDQPPSPDKRAALAALCSPGPDICILDEASRTNNKPKLPRFRRLLDRTRTKSRLALTCLPLAGFVSRAWSIVEWACPGLFGTSIEYQWRYVDPIIRGHKREAAVDDAQLAFSKACLLYNKMGMVTFTVDSATRKEALLSKGLSLHESLIWINLSRKEYTIYREVEVLLNKAVTDEQFSPFIACSLLICAASSVQALRRTLKRWADADPNYLESIGHRKTFAMHQEFLQELLRIVDMHMQERLMSTKLQLALYVGRQCLLKGERLVIFASSHELFEEAHEYLQSGLEQAKVHTYDAATPGEVRTDSIHRFNTAPDGAILVAPYGPNSHCMEEAGWGFVNATRALFLDSSWHSGACVQAVNRVHGFAQLNDQAHIHHFLASGTVEQALSSVLEWRYRYMSSCDSSTLPATMSCGLDERGFLLAPEVSPTWIRANPPEELSRCGTATVTRSDPGENVNFPTSKEHEDLILPLRKVEDTHNGDKCVHEIVLNSNRYRSLSENLDLWMRSEWSRKTRYLSEVSNELDRKDSLKAYREVLYTLGGDMLHKARRCGNSGSWLAQDSVFMEHDSDICHLLNAWEPYRRLYERSVQITDLPAENGTRGEKRPRSPEEGRGSPPKARRYHEA